LEKLTERILNLFSKVAELNFQKYNWNMFNRKKQKEEIEISKLISHLKNAEQKYEDLLKYVESVEKRFDSLKEIFFLDLNNYVNNNFEEVPKVNNKITTLENLVGDSNILFQIDSSESQKNQVPAEIEVVLKNMELSFSDKLMEIIRTKNLNEVEVYKKADIDRRLFSKIRSNSNYRPTKDTIILLCLSMKLNFEEVSDLFLRAGFSFSKSDKRDLIAEYFFKKELYDIFLYKDILFKYGFIKE
jgi:hypothetical protein